MADRPFGKMCRGGAVARDVTHALIKPAGMTDAGFAAWSDLDLTCAMVRLLPPLNPLRTFEAAARHCHFTKAADELNVSQSAVSRQISVLEAYLGVRLFVRDAHALRLTTAGLRYFAEIGPAFQLLTAATVRLRKSTTGAPLKIKVYATFAAKWLLRRLPRFHESHPGINIRISAAVTQVDFSRDQVDAAIQLGRGDWPRAQALRLFRDAIAPVASPNLLRGVPLPLTPAQLSGFRLLHAHYRRDDWPDWLRAAGHELPADDEPIAFPSSLLTYQAAIDGLGIAMGQLPLLDEELRSGTLLQVSPPVLRRDLAYYLILPRDRPADKRMMLFRAWLLAEAAEHSPPTSAMTGSS